MTAGANRWPGERDRQRTVFINTLTLGSHTVRNVHVSVTDENGIMLLGFDVLSQMSRKFAINTAASMLEFD
jgi:predicted aspartyl protease